jgi:phage-related protein
MGGNLARRYKDVPGRCAARCGIPSSAYRILYIAKFRDAVYVLHAFQKRRRKTAKKDIELARRRLGELIRGLNTQR